MQTQETPRVAIVTGGAGGLGLPIAQRLAEKGHKVAIWDLDAERAETAAAGLPGARGYAVDVTDRDAVNAATTRVVADMGPLGILVTSAGHNGPLAPFADYPQEGWDFVMSLNLNAVFHCCQAGVREMLKTGYGRIVNISSSAAQIGGYNGSAAYVASKGAILSLTKVVAREAAPLGITVNAIAPGAFPTDAEKIHPDPAGYNAMVLERQAVKRRGHAGDIAAAIRFFLSDEAGFITGQSLAVNGGWTMH